MREFEELRIRILKIGTRRYFVFANGPCSSAADVVELGRMPEEYASDLDKILDRKFRGSSVDEQLLAGELRDLGITIFKKLVARPIAECIRENYRYVVGKVRALRLRFDADADLMRVPFEVMSAEPNDELAILLGNPDISLARSLPALPAGHLRRPGSKDPFQRLHIVVVVASPEVASREGEVYDRLDAHLEMKNLKGRVGARLNLGHVLLHELGLPRGGARERATLEMIGEKINVVGQEPCAVLVVAHGKYDAQNKQGMIVLETEDGKPDPVSGEDLARALMPAQALRLVVLNICWGGRGGAVDLFSGVAQALMRTGLPVVVAMQGEVSDNAATRFSPGLLATICRNAWVDKAVQSGRNIMDKGSRAAAIEWCIPVLFLHNECSHAWLFKVRPPAEDPLKADEACFRDVVEGSRTITPKMLERALWYCRSHYLWGEAADFVDLYFPIEEFSSYRDELHRLRAEAVTERGVPEVKQICLDLASQGIADVLELRTLARKADELQNRIGGPITQRLKREVSDALSLSELYHSAGAAERAGNWDAAISSYEAIIVRGRAVAAGVEKALERCREEKKLEYLYAEVSTAYGARQWTQVADGCGKILSKRCDGYKDARELCVYAEAQRTSAAGDWTAAVAALEQVPDDWRDGDARRLRRYAEGRLAEVRGDWDGARIAYAEAGTGVPETSDLDRRKAYAEARVSEGSGKWKEAAEQYDAACGILDAGNRRLYNIGRLAIAEKQWGEARKSLESLPNDFLDIGELLAAIFNQLYEIGISYEQGGRWSEARTIFQELPHDFKDSPIRERYAAGRLAESEGRLVEAANAYGDVEGNHADIAKRLPYVRGRLAEDEDRWRDAAREYEAVPGDHEDSGDLLLYARGRAAEAAEEWENVAPCFGGLDDNHRDVGPRRSFARACTAACTGNWGAVLESLKSLQDDGRGGEVGWLRSYAQGRLVEMKEAWEVAVAAYGLVPPDWRIPPDYRDVTQRLAYARGRVAEKRGEWAEAVAAYHSLPVDYGDVAVRRPYADGRSAESREDWVGAAEAYDKLRERYGDAPHRLAYCRGRVAEEQKDWPAVVATLYRLPDDFRDVRQLRAYATGRMAEEAEDWIRASACFAGAGDYPDSRSRKAYADGRMAEATGHWRRAARAFTLVGDDHPDAASRLARLTSLLDTLPWLDGLADARLVADPWAVKQGNIPYAALADAGITPSSSAAEVRDASFVLMEQGSMCPEARAAWDQLRALPVRLRVDAFLYRLHDACGLRDIQRLIEPAPAAELRARMCKSLPSDAGLILLLDRSREEAIALWENRLRDDPCDVPTAHALGVAHVWLAREMEARGAWEHAEAAWERAIAEWALVLSDDACWSEFQRDRGGAYHQMVTQSDVARLRSELAQMLLDDLAAYADRYAAYGSPGRAEKFRDLGLALEIELEGARALKEVGGIPLEGGPARRLVCGPLHVRHAGVETALARFVSELQREAGEVGEDEDLQTVLDSALRIEREERGAAVTREAVRRLRCAFSELAKPAVHLEHQNPERTLHSLPAIYRTRLSRLPADCTGFPETDQKDHLRTCQHCQEFRRHNPGYLCLAHRYAYLLQDAVELATRAHLSLAQMVLTGGKIDLDRVLAHWAAAVAAARNAGAQVRTKRAIMRVILGRCEALSRESGRRRGERLTEAIDLIERARGLIGAADGGQLVATESELLTARGVWYGYGCHEYEDPDYEKGGRDLRRALELNPESLDTRDNLARALIFNAANLGHAGKRQRSFELASEAVAVLHEGLRRTRGHRQLLNMLLQTLDHLEELTLHDVSFDDLDRRLREPRGADAAPLSSRSAAAAAVRKLEAGDVSAAVTELIRVVRSSPDDDAIRQMLLDALRRKGAGSR